MINSVNSLLKEDLKITGLDCADCAAKLEKKIQNLSEVNNAKLNFATAKLHLEYYSDLTIIENTIKESGYGIEKNIVQEGAEKNSVKHWYKETRVLLTIISGCLILLGMILVYLKLPPILNILAFSVSMLTGGYYIAKSSYYSIKNRSLDMNLLMTISAIGAAFIGEWSEGASVVFLFSLGNVLQNLTMDKARNSIRSLIELSPKEALVRRKGHEVLLKLDDIKIGDIVIIKPAEKIPVDGRVIKGASSVNQAPITGESIPIIKNINDEVFAGTINNEGYLEVGVTKLVGDTTLARIIHLVEEAQEQKAPSQQFVEVFSKYYTPIVIYGAIAIAVIPSIFFSMPFLPWFKKALILLVISCPCALVISTPVSIVAAIGNAAKKGVLIKGGAYLENIAKIKAIAFDKTGTLTKGHPEVTDILSFTNLSEIEVMSLIGALEKRSQHPLGNAVIKWLENNQITVPESKDFRSLPGQGVQASINGQIYNIGNLKLYENLGVNIPDEFLIKINNLELDGKTIIILGTDSSLLGVVGLADVIRESTSLVINKLKEEGIQGLVMLTGDNEGTARAVSAKIGIDQFQANLLPEDKLTIINELINNYGSVAMVGDGVNDAPALAKATLGIAMGGAGTDTALESADLVLMADDLNKLPFAIRLSRKALTIIKENIGFSLVIKAIFLVLTFLGMANLWMAVFADTGAALIVILNGMRLMRTK